MIDAITAVAMGLGSAELRHMLADCDRPRGAIRGTNAKGFWRVDRQRYPELRRTVLAFVAFSDLLAKIKGADGGRERGIASFLAQNDVEGWLLPETLRLADYDLGHDDRARHPQPVAARLGPRFYDWQLTQSGDEALRECHLHARNLLGRVEYPRVLNRLIESGVVTAEQFRELLDHDACDVIREDPNPQTPVADGMIIGHGRAMRAAEPDAVYPTDPSSKRPQTQVFQDPQTELFD